MIPSDVTSKAVLDSRAGRTTAQQREAIARCIYLQRQQRPFGLVTGSKGSGKTHTLVEFQKSCTQSPAVVIEMAGLDQDGFLSELEAELGLPHHASQTNQVGLIEARIRSLSECGTTQAVLLDHLDEADDSVYLVIRRLLRLHSRFPGLTIIGAATSPYNESIRQLVQDFADLRIDIGVPNQQETTEFIKQADPSVQISEVAADQIREITSGVPRELERLLRLIPQAAKVDRKSAADTELVSGLASELP